MKALVASVSAAFALLLLPGSAAHALRLPAARHCPVFPANNAWNQRVDKLPVAADSARLIASIGLDAPAHADFGSGKWDGGPIGIPFDVVSRTTPLHRVSFQYADESNRVRYPIPRHVQIEGGAHATGDRHAILVDKSSCRLYELYDLRHTRRGWTAGSGAVWNLRSNHLRPAGWTSADAAGLPIFPGLVRYDEAAAGHVNHAIRVTVDSTQNAWVHPASHCAGDTSNPSAPPMGLRLRLGAGYDISAITGPAHAIAAAMKQYGLIVADNGSNWFFSGTSDRRWSDENLDQLKSIPGSAFQVVQSAAAIHHC